MSEAGKKNLMKKINDLISESLQKSEVKETEIINLLLYLMSAYNLSTTDAVLSKCLYAMIGNFNEYINMRERKGT